jgi:hypothetical protein
MLLMTQAQHLTVRVAWHQDRWNGTVCQAASRNTYCLDLDRIREERVTTHAKMGKAVCTSPTCPR